MNGQRALFHTKRNWFIVGVWLMGLLFIAVTQTVAQTVVSDDDVNAVAKDLFCPVCENTPLDVCPTQACDDWRELIRQQLTEGQTSDEIKAYFAFQYGDHVLAEPPRTGFDLVVWVLPFATILIGGVFFFRYLRQLNRPGQVVKQAPAPPPVANAPALDDYIVQIEKELSE